MGAPPKGYIAGFICTLKTCSVHDWGYVKYQPSLIANVIFLVLIDLLGFAQIVLGAYFRTGLVCLCMILGIAAESTGYVSRVLLHFDPFSRVYFLMYLINLTIGPAFIAAAIYLSLGRIVVVYGEEISRLRPRTYTVFFMGCDAISLSIQAVGGGIAASVPLTNTTMIDLGTHILIAGLSFQVASLFAFAVCAAEFLWRVKKHPELRNPEFSALVNSKRFRMFIYMLFIATAALFVRTVFRSVELSGGFSGKLANNQAQFIVLDGVMVLLATIGLTVFHPGYAFQGRWNDCRFKFFGPNVSMGYEERSQQLAEVRNAKADKEARIETRRAELVARRNENRAAQRYVSTSNEKTAPQVTETVTHGEQQSGKSGS